MPAAEAFDHIARDLAGTDTKLSRRKPKTETLPARVTALLASSAQPMSAPAIARALGVSWPTAAATLKSMTEAGAVLAGTTPGGQHRYGAPLAAPAAPRGQICKSLDVGAGPELETMLRTLGQSD